VEFLEAPLFTRLLPEFLTDEAYRELQQYLAREPEAGDIIPGTGGFRKLRWADTRRGKGKRGGLRMIYYYLASDSQIWLMTVYDKDSAIDLTPGESGRRRPPSNKRLESAHTEKQGGGRSDGQEGEATQDSSETEPVPRDHVRGAGDA
jgi:hypothetical protein